jgi:tRNA threonylcarbamoyladenosine biosynthesis protein TsaB
MKILGIETSTMLGGVAVVDEHRGLIAETRLNVKTTHSERLMAVIDRTLSQSELEMNDIDAFAVAMGPGSFTGLRIGLSTVKGLSFSTGRPVVAVPTLDAFAWNFPYCRYPVCLMFDARKSEVYAAVFQWGKEEFEKVVGDVSIRPEDLLGKLRGEVLFAGEGALLYRDMIAEVIGERAHMAPPDKMVPSPANVAVMGLRKALGGEYSDAAEAAPFYIRKSEAEVKCSKGK